jgi:hypothetical protein
LPHTRHASRFGPEERSDGLIARDGGDALHEVEDAFGLAPLLDENGLDDLRRLDLREPALAQEVCAILVAAGDDLLRAALMPLTNGTGEELAKRVNAGAASCAKRCEANLLCRMVISSKSSTAQGLRFWQTARR